MPKFFLYTDGSSASKYSHGAYVMALYVEGSETPIKESSSVVQGGDTDASTMELLAVAEGLEMTQVGAEVTAVCDSASVVKVGLSISTRGSPGNPGLPMRHREIWQRIQKAAADREVKFVWVKGHKNDVRHNNVDRVSRFMMRRTLAVLKQASPSVSRERHCASDAPGAKARLANASAVTPDFHCGIDEEIRVPWVVIGFTLVLALVLAVLVFVTGWHANFTLLVIGFSATVLLAILVAVLRLLAPAEDRPAFLRAIVATIRSDFKDILRWFQIWR